MNIKEQFTTVTPFSKFLALIVFILLPIGGFLLGVEYSSVKDLDTFRSDEQPNSFDDLAGGDIPTVKVEVSETAETTELVGNMESSLFESEYHNILLMVPRGWKVDEVENPELAEFEGERERTPIIELKPINSKEVFVNIWDVCMGLGDTSTDFVSTGPENGRVHTLYLCKDGYLFSGNVWDGGVNLEGNKKFVKEISESFKVVSSIPYLTLTIDNNNPSPGETFIINVVSSEPVDDEVLWLVRFYNDSKHGDYVQGPGEFGLPQWVITTPKTYAGIQRFVASAEINNKEIKSNEFKVVVKPDMELLHQIFFNPAGTYIMVPGQELELEVVGRFSNGYNYIISQQEMGTVYTENIVINNFNITPGDSPAIIVSKDGVVTALTPGIAEVVATNNGISNIRRIRVVDE